jgi:hypothetical protein
MGLQPPGRRSASKLCVIFRSTSGDFGGVGQSAGASSTVADEFALGGMEASVAEEFNRRRPTPAGEPADWGAAVGSPRRARIARQGGQERAYRQPDACVSVGIIALGKRWEFS